MRICLKVYHGIQWLRVSVGGDDVGMEALSSVRLGVLAECPQALLAFMPLPTDLPLPAIQCYTFPEGTPGVCGSGASSCGQPSLGQV